MLYYQAVRQLLRLRNCRNCKDSAEYQDALVRLQIALATKGFEVGAIDGQLKARTVAAIYEYQTASGLIPSGKPTQETFTSLGIVI